MCEMHKGGSQSRSSGGMQKAGLMEPGMRQRGPDIVDTAVSAGGFNTLVTAVKAAGLVDVRKGEGPFTVFAPTDAAFAKLPEGALEALLADKEKLAAVLTYHLVPGRLDPGKVVSMYSWQTVQGSELPVHSISIAKTDIEVSNGIIQVIDEVLIPQGWAVCPCGNRPRASLGTLGFLMPRLKTRLANPKKPLPVPADSASDAL